MYYPNRNNNRHPFHDYSQPCTYFITLNVRLGRYLFGKVTSSATIELTPLGKTTAKYWLEIPEHFENVRLDKMIVMPNHLHGIIHIGINPPLLTKHQSTPKQPNHFGPLPKGSLGVIIGQFKASVTRWANQNSIGGLFSWQPRYYDRIITNPKDLWKYRIYIQQNPEKWWLKYGEQTW